MAVELKAQKRDIFRKKLAGLRRQNLIPAELYGREVENVHLSVDAKEFKHVLKEAGESSVITLTIGNEKRPVLIHNVHLHPISGEVLSIDFYQVKMDEVTQTNVSLEFIGESPAVEDKDGVLVKAMQEVEVEALPGDIPRSIEVDLTQLIDIDQSLHVKDLPAIKNVKILTEPDVVIASVKAQMTEEEEKALEDEGKDVGEVKVAGEEKEEGGDSEKEKESESSLSDNDKEA